jgi:predicted lipid carrier protein YhbT
MNHYHRYFSDFLPGILDKLLIEDLETLTSCFEIEVTDAGDPPWWLGIDAGRLTYVGHAGPEPVCRFSLDSDTLLEVVTARCTPAAAFFDTRIELTGDMEMGLKLSTVLEPFFDRFPYTE